jgi:hypothetical protein
MIDFPVRSIDVAPSGIATRLVSPISAMLPPRMMTVCF